MSEFRKLGDLRNPPKAASVSSTMSSGGPMTSGDTSRNSTPGRRRGSLMRPPTIGAAATPAPTKYTSAAYQRGIMDVETIEREMEGIVLEQQQQEQQLLLERQQEGKHRRNYRSSPSADRRRQRRVAEEEETAHQYAAVPHKYKVENGSDGGAVSSEVPYATATLTQYGEVTVLEQLVVTMEAEQATMEQKFKEQERFHESQRSMERNKLTTLQAQYGELQRYTTNILERRTENAEAEVEELKTQVAALQQASQEASVQTAADAETIKTLQDNLDVVQKEESSLKDALESSALVFEDIRKECRSTAKLCDELKTQKKKIDDENAELKQIARHDKIQSRRYELMEQTTFFDLEKAQRQTMTSEHDNEVNQFCLNFYKDELWRMVVRDMKLLKQEQATAKELNGARLRSEILDIEQRCSVEAKARQQQYEETVSTLSSQATTAAIERDLLREEVQQWKESSQHYRAVVDVELPMFVETLSLELHRVKEAIYQEEYAAHQNTTAAVTAHLEGSISSGAVVEGGWEEVSEADEGAEGGISDRPAAVRSGSRSQVHTEEVDSTTKRSLSLPQALRNETPVLHYTADAATTETHLKLLALWETKVQESEAALEVEVVLGQELRVVIAHLQETAVLRAAEQEDSLVGLQRDVRALSERNKQLEVERASILKENGLLVQKSAELGDLHAHHEESLASLSEQFFAAVEEKDTLQEQLDKIKRKMTVVVEEETKTRNHASDSIRQVETLLDSAAHRVKEMTAQRNVATVELSEAEDEKLLWRLRTLESVERCKRQAIEHECDLYYARRNTAAASGRSDGGIAAVSSRVASRSTATVPQSPSSSLPPPRRTAMRSPSSGGSG